MDLIAGGSLDTELTSRDVKDIPWGTRHRHLLAIATGMNYLHHGHIEPVLHRDLRSANILLTGGINEKNTIVKIADFGMSKGWYCRMRHVFGRACSKSRYENWWLFGQDRDAVNVSHVRTCLLSQVSVKSP
jgi:serine/threonine protein kinase